MTFHSHIFNLKVQKIDQICTFNLAWGEARQLNRVVDYPEILTQLYEEWQKAYTQFYQLGNLRGQRISGGIGNIPFDWRSELVKAESKLMYNFNNWLRSAELYDIRSTIVQASQELVTVFLTCTPIDISRLPWEEWEICNDFATTKKIQLMRTSLNIGTNIGSYRVNHNNLKSRRTRILVILGDDPGLNLQKDEEALKSLRQIAEVTSWKPKQKGLQAIQELTNIIVDERGWDILFFAGHSQETEITGGEFSIAPGVAISIKEIASPLTLAKQRGLQVAIFNSCSGLNIADSLINLGLSQVLVMREQINNEVAQEFLVLFLQGLQKHFNIYESMIAARESLRGHMYPSACLIPSLFCHPGTKLFRIPPWECKQQLKQLLSTNLEILVLLISLILSGIPPFSKLVPDVEDQLIDTRMFIQSIYRQVTSQIPSDEPPPVVLVEIDQKSISHNNLVNVHPMDRSYIAKLINKLRNLHTAVVGVDFVFDLPEKEPPSGDRDLSQAVRQAVDSNMWLIFGAIMTTSNRELGVNDSTAIAHINSTLQGYIDTYANSVELPNDCDQACPIAYLIALVETAKQEMRELPQPQSKRTANLRTKLLDEIKNHGSKTGNLSVLFQITSFFGAQPLIDFSIPPKHIYTKIPAWKLLENSDTEKFALNPQQVVLIASGADDRLGMAPGSPDYSPASSAVNYWTQQFSLTGGELLAYMIHHFLKHRLVIPIPNIWMIGIVIILGKVMVFMLKRTSDLSPKLRQQIMITSIGGVIVYGIATLQIFISMAILLPWFLPSSIFLFYILTANGRKYNV